MSPSLRRRSSGPTGIDYESSNTATAKAIGGIQRPWMTGSVSPPAGATRSAATFPRHTGLNSTTQESSRTLANDVCDKKQQCIPVTASLQSPEFNHDHLSRQNAVTTEADIRAGGVATTCDQANTMPEITTRRAERGINIGEAASSNNTTQPEISSVTQPSLFEPLSATSMGQRPDLEADSWLLQLTEAAKRPEMQAFSPGPRSSTGELSTKNHRNINASLPPGLHKGYDFPYYAETLAKRMQLVAANSLGRSTIEAGRLQLLQDACEVQDYDYLHIHQLCFIKTKHGNFANFRGPFSYQVSHEAGMGTLEELLAGNKDLAADSIDWFCNFPQPPSLVIREASQYQSSISRIRRLLANFADGWMMALMSHRSSHEPPSIEDIWSRLLVDSPTLQLVIFRALLRVSWIGSTGPCFCYQSCEQVFRKSQEIVRSTVHHQKLRSSTQLIAAVSIKTRLVFQWRLAEHKKHATMQFRHQNSTEVPYNLNNSSTSLHNTATPSNISPGLLNTSSPTATTAPADSSYAQSIIVSGSEMPGSQSLTLTSPTRHMTHMQMNGLTPYVVPFSPALDQHTNHISRSGPHGYSLPTANSNIQGRTFPMPQYQPEAGYHILPNANYYHSSHIDQRSARSISTDQYSRRAGLSHTAQAPIYQGQHPSVTAQHNTSSRGNFFMGLKELNNSPNRFYFSPESSRQPNASQNDSPSVVRGNSQAGSFDSPNIAYTNWSNRPDQPFSPPDCSSNINNGRSGIFMNPVQASIPHMGLLSSPRVQSSSFDPSLVAQNPNPQLPPVDDRFLAFPPPESLWSLPAVANPRMTALHQASAHEPHLSFEPAKDSMKSTKIFRFVKQVYIAEATIGRTTPYHNQIFQVQASELMMVAQDANDLRGRPIRKVSSGTLLYRIRCTKTFGQCHVPMESQVVTADTYWPPSITVLLNGAALEIRRKSHHGKDLPIDVTRMIKEGANEMEAAVICLDEHNNDRYAVCVEKVEVIDEELIKSHLVTMPWEQALAGIHDRVQPTLEADPDVEVVDCPTVLDLTDPFTAGIFTTPVRGRECRHHQCFDLGIFLQTRKTAAPAQPCEPEEFRCPICKGDARPPSLTLDGFFAKVRAELESLGRLDVKAVVLREGDKWEIKEERNERPSKSEEHVDMKMESEDRATRDKLGPEIIDLSD